MKYLSLIILLISFTSSAQTIRYQYFADLPFWESPIQLFQGQRPISKQQAETLLHARVGYDKHGRITEIQARQQGQSKPFYRGFGSLYLYAPNTQVRYHEERVTLSFYNLLGNRTKVLGEVWTVGYTMDKRGRFTHMGFFDQQGKLIENQYGYANYYWQHALNGSVIETRDNLAGELLPHRPGFEFERIRMTFDYNGHLSLMQNIDENNQLIASKSGAAQYRYFYNDEGGFDRWEVYDAAGNPALGPTGTTGEQYTFNDKGWTRIAFFNTQGQPDYHASGAVNWHAKYDSFGNMTARWFTDADMNNIDGKYGFHKVEYLYDKQSMHLIGHRFLDKDNQLTEIVTGVAQVQYIRDDKGNLLQQNNFNKQHQLVMDDWQQYASVTHQYDQHGNRIQTTRFNKQGDKLVKSE